jgi:hypothetical protein
VGAMDVLAADVVAVDVVSANLLEEVLARVEFENDELADEVGMDGAVYHVVAAKSSANNVPEEHAV